ncbi:MAG TPA: EAL domain-containing protein [Rhodopila sp.]|uniref:putative bifunctional diguanylate cyclase/phosphodiesterase n=1 Tax=Rhodopila sp. TaxID=2480087 RepID=UPI002C935D92|nr:EAL domain-containing protein [Rhodopila sp.]HVY16035.1 EAL domain-containing protein [Rhodopila sp.]
MLTVVTCITQQHDISLVVAAGLICCLASFATINMLWRSSSHEARVRTVWLSGAALVFGTGAWTAHFVAMLAFRSGMLVGYDAFLTGASLVVACAGAWTMFWVFLNGRSNVRHRAVAGMLLGVIVGAMHFIGTEAMRFNGSIRIKHGFAGAAVAFAMVFCGLALGVSDRLASSSRRAAGAVLLAVGIVGLHFIGMAGLDIAPGSGDPLRESPWEPSGHLMLGTPLLATIVIATTATIFVLSLFGSFMDQYLAWRTGREEGSLRHIAHHDSLTGLPNRLALRHALEGILQEAQRQGAACAVMCLDLDRFKLVNDLYGHQTGDEVLRRVAARLQSLTRPTDVVARISGDEFIVVMPPTLDPDAAVMSARFVAALAEPMMIDGQQICIGGSVGIALYPRDGTDGGELLRNADMALYQAKRDGRGTFRFFDPEMNERLRSRQRLEQDLRRGIDAGEFQMYYQPLFAVETRRIIGYEALIRWDHPTRGIVSPSEFIPIAEESGLIVPLGRWVLETACREASAWEDDLQVSVNVSPVQLQQTDFAEMVADTLVRTGFPAHRLELEMTEGVLIAHPEQALAMLRKLRDCGVRLALDDFGTGYSSLSYLRRFPFSKIKIDRSFIQSLGECNESSVLARAIVALGHSLGMGVTAEGVETYEQYNFLEREACNQVQGYLFGKPMPAHYIRTKDRGFVPPRVRIDVEPAAQGRELHHSV